MSEKSSEESKRMETSALVRNAMWQAFPPRPEQNRKGWLWEVARALGWRHRRVKALFYCEARVVTADEWRTINERLDAAKNRERQRDELRMAARGLGANVSLGSREDLPLPMALEAVAAGGREKHEA